MRPGTHDGQSARFRLNFCRGGIVLLFLDAEIVFVPPQSPEGMGELVQLVGANKLEGAHTGLTSAAIAINDRGARKQHSSPA
jgi:hypothetical protein